jgi:lipopolysaccharide transport protein LptA
MISLMALLLACAGPHPGSDAPLPERAVFEGVQLSLPGQGLVLRAAQAQAAEPQQGSATDVVAQLGEQPGLSIESEHASWDLRGQSVVFEGSVSAERGAFTLECDRLEASFDSPEQLRTAEATGAVRVRHGERLATGDRAVLDVGSGRLEIEGEPVVTEGGRSLRGERIVLFLDDERLECERCSLVITPGDAPTAADGQP